MRHANTHARDTYSEQLAGTMALAQSVASLLRLCIAPDRAAMAPGVPGMDKTVDRAIREVAAAAQEQQRERPAAVKPAAPAPKLQTPTLVAAGCDDSDRATF